MIDLSVSYKSKNHTLFMSYIAETYSIDDYLAHISKVQASIVRSALSSFDRFSMDKYKISGKTMLQDVGNEKNENKVMKILSEFSDWLKIEHPNIMISFGKAGTQRPFEPLHPRTIKNYVKQIKYIFEDCYGIVINDRQFKRKVTIESPEKFTPEPITKEELKLIMQYSMSSKRVLYMTLKDSE